MPLMAIYLHTQLCDGRKGPSKRTLDLQKPKWRIRRSQRACCSRRLLPV